MTSWLIQTIVQSRHIVVNYLRPINRNTFTFTRNTFGGYDISLILNCSVSIFTKRVALV